MRIMAYAPYGCEGIIIQVEADIRRGIPGIDITGLAEGAVREARERVRAAFRNSGFTFPQDRILINLAPAGVRKAGASLDLPIALAVMAAAGLIPRPGTETVEGGAFTGTLMVLGELELSGRLRPVRGVLAAAAAGFQAGIRDFIVPAENAQEAAILESCRYAAAATLEEAAHTLRHLAQTGAFPAQTLPTAQTGPSGALCAARNALGPSAEGVLGLEDFAEVKGQGRYKRALEIAAAGGHNLLVFGPPGAGKTMLARRMPSIMPPLSSWEAMEVARLHSLARLSAWQECSLITRPPFRSPHHSASAEGILGGGKTVRPGEISLAHYGVLFLDEAPEFRSNVLQALREPLEDRVITIARAEGPVRLPADFQILLSANTCPCGRLGLRSAAGPDLGRRPPVSRDYGPSCFCSSDEIHRYWRKFSGALLDRVELRVAVMPPDPALLCGAKQGGGAHPPALLEEPSWRTARRVLQAARIQRERFQGSGIRRNARIPPGQVEALCPLTAAAEQALRVALEKLALSGRACHGILRLGRTIADLEGAECIGAVHILEAVEHRRLGDDPYDILEAQP
jgi:magnesium chelatase family protein